MGKSSIGYGHRCTCCTTDLVYPPPEALPARAAGLEKHGVVGHCIDGRVQSQERVRDGLAVRRVQCAEYLRKEFPRSSVDVIEMKMRRTAMTSASRTTASESSRAMMIFTFSGVMYPYTATSSTYNKPR